MRTEYLATALVIAAAAWYVYGQDEAQDEETGGGFADDLFEEAAQTIDDFTGGVMQLSAMGRVTNVDVSNPNVQAFLKTIRRGEGTADVAGYSRMYGGSQFASFVDHPRKKITAGAYTSTAAGAYQILMGTWDETRKIMKLNNFSPAAQDLAAVGLIARRGALDDVKAGRFEVAIRKCAKEWASLPGSPYGQPVISMGTAYSTYAANGGMLEAA
jgi:muramidase (phage lysozyme)